MYMDNTEMTDGVNVSVVNALGSGFRMWRHPQAKAMSPESMQLEIEKDFGVLFNVVGKFYQENSGDYKPVKKASVIAAMFATFEANPLKAPEFWKPICDLIGLESKTDARWHFRNFLDNHMVSTRAGDQAVSKEDVFRIATLAWNKWRKNIPVVALRSPNKRLKVLS